MCWLQWFSHGVSDVPSLFSRHIFPMWRCSQTAATNGSVNLQCARQSPKYMRSATNWEKRRWDFWLDFVLMHLLVFCECDRAIFVVVPNSSWEISNLLWDPYESLLSTLSGFWYWKHLVTLFRQAPKRPKPEDRAAALVYEKVSQKCCQGAASASRHLSGYLNTHRAAADS